MSRLAPARYFPVKATPLRMEAGLKPLATPFGNGTRDRLFFQVDAERERYLAAKRRVPDSRHVELTRGRADRLVHERVRSWMATTLRHEHPAEPWREGFDSYRAFAHQVQEDFAVLARASGAGQAIAVYVCFPSGWRPEQIAGRSFREIHAPVPGFAERDAPAESMVRAMVGRGPYVRFVWTICADDELDHHPEQGRRAPWREDGPVWLRVERQVTVPFPEVDASLFLIRTYLYEFASLSANERTTLAAALRAMPPELRRYKGLEGTPCEIAIRRLEEPGGARSPSADVALPPPSIQRTPTM